MTVAAPREPIHRDDVLGRLEGVSGGHGASDVASRIGELRRWIDADLREVEEALARIDRRDTPMHDSAQHLLALPGKRLRPTCVAVAARLGQGFGPAARELAVAVELVHAATLLHDDVVDVGDVRRGAPAARVLYGNAASIFAGDWLLVEALGRVRDAGVPDVLDRMLLVLKAMLEAEALQLAARGRVSGDVEQYFRVVEGKTASLFQWAMFAGARAGKVVGPVCDALEVYGRRLGVAFQIVDDVLDLSGDADVVGKSLFADLREGKMTYPLLLAVERDPDLAEAVREACATDVVTLEVQRKTAAAIRKTRAKDDSLALARRLCDEAVAALAPLPPGRGREALESIAMASLARKK